MQGPQGTPAEKTVASVTFIKNFSENETLKRIAWPGYICFYREKQHYELPSEFSIKHEDLLPVPQEPTTFRNKEDIKRLKDWRNEFGRGVRQQSAQNSFTSRRKTKLALSLSLCTPRRMQTTAPRNKLSHQYRSFLRGDLCKSGPGHFASEKSFPSNFAQ